MDYLESCKVRFYNLNYKKESIVLQSGPVNEIVLIWHG